MISTVPLRLAFQAHNRRGLGHLMRGLNIASAVRELAPESAIMFYTRNPSAAELCGSAFQYVVEDNPEQLAHWPAAVRDFAPHVIVYDTLLPAPTDASEAAARSVYVMRKCKPERQQQIFAGLGRQPTDCILIPHTPDEFGYALPSALASRSHFVGPIVRPTSQAGQTALRTRYQLDADDFLLVSTPGGGGFADDAASFFAVAQAAHQQIRQARPNLRHLVVTGPHYQGQLPAQPGMTVVGYEPAMADLLAIASLVIAEGGYNTVHELRAAQVPAIFLPGERSYDDQAERVRALEQRGLAVVCTDRTPEHAARTIAAIAGSDALLEGMRASYRHDRLQTGNRAAAEHIVALAGGWGLQEYHVPELVRSSSAPPRATTHYAL